jgi:hypothetical protein
MSDNIEKFIKNNRPEFDDRQPTEKVWKAVNKSLERNDKRGGRMVSIWRFTRIAAASVVLIGAGVLIGLNYNKNPKPDAFHQLYPEFAETELFYKKQVKIKEAELANYKYDPAIDDDLKQLDKIFEDLKKELSNTPVSKREQVINAMVNNYRTKISILERVLERIQSTKQENLKTKQNDSTEI